MRAPWTRMTAVGSAIAAVAALGACRSVLGLEDLPVRPVDAGAEPEASKPPPNAVDPAWAQWRMPPDTQPRVELDAPGTARATVTDLLWQRASGPPGSWSEGAEFCAALALAPDPDGVTSWRLPTRIELMSLVDFERPIDGHPFPRELLDPRADCYWTVSGETDLVSHWLFNPNDGVFGISLKDSNPCVPRCVRGTPYEYAADRNNPPAYVIENGVVRDPLTRLEWQDVGEDGAGKLVSFEAATAQCADLRLLGHADWRLPTVKELASLVDERRTGPALDPRLHGERDVYWSSTLHEPSAGSPADGGTQQLAWRVSFADGTTVRSDDSFAFTAGIALVRCVRDY